MRTEDKEKAMSIVCSYYGLTSEEITSKYRYRKIVEARQILCRLLSDMKCTQGEIGEFINLAHASVSINIKHFNDDYRYIPIIAENYNRIKAKFLEELGLAENNKDYGKDD